MAVKLSADGRRMITGYIPNNALTYVGLVLYGVLAIIFALRLWRQGSKYMLSVTIGSFCMAIGFGVRIPMHEKYDDLTIYIVQYMFLLLSPCAFIAQSYVVLPRLVTWLNAEEHLFLKSRIVVRLFVWSDVFTFFLQASGGGMTAVDSLSIANIGKWVTIVGLALQLLSFGLFTYLALRFGYRVRKHSPQKWHQASPLLQRGNWRAVYYALLWTTVGIMVRCVFRLVEFAQGYDGTLRTVEVYFYVLDALPLWLAILVWTVVWPPALIPALDSPFTSGAGSNPEELMMTQSTLPDKDFASYH